MEMCLLYLHVLCCLLFFSRLVLSVWCCESHLLCSSSYVLCENFKCVGHNSFPNVTVKDSSAKHSCQSGNQSVQFAD